MIATSCNTACPVATQLPNTEVVSTRCERRSVSALPQNSSASPAASKPHHELRSCGSTKATEPSSGAGRQTTATVSERPSITTMSAAELRLGRCVWRERLPTPQQRVAWGLDAEEPWLCDRHRRARCRTTVPAPHVLATSLICASPIVLQRVVCGRNIVCRVRENNVGVVVISPPWPLPARRQPCRQRRRSASNKRHSYGLRGRACVSV